MRGNRISDSAGDFAAVSRVRGYNAGIGATLPVVRSLFRYRTIAAIYALAALVASFAGCSRERPQALAATPPQQQPSIEFAAEWGVRGDAPGQLDDPAGPASDATGRLYLINRVSGSVQKFLVSGTALLSFDYPSIRSAAAIAIDSGGGIYAANARAGLIQVFFPEGDLLRIVRVAPQRDWQGPFAFSVNAAGSLVVPDPVGGRIQVVSSRGQIERVWRVPVPPGNAAERVAPIAAVAAPDGFVYVGDAGAGRVIKFSADGREVAEWGATSGATDKLLGLAVWRQYVFALRSGSPHLQVWTLDGKPMLTDDLGGRIGGSSGNSADVASFAGAPPASMSMAITPRGELAILDPTAPRMFIFRIHLDVP